MYLWNILFFLHGVCSASRIYRLLVFTKLGCFWPLFLQVFLSFSFFPPSKTSIMHILVCLMVFHRSLMLCSLLLILFLSVLQIRSFLLIHLQVCFLPNSFVYQFKSTTEPLQWNIYFSYGISTPKFSVFITSLSIGVLQIPDLPWRCNLPLNKLFSLCNSVSSFKNEGVVMNIKW